MATKSYRSVIKTEKPKVFVKKLVREIRELQEHTKRKIAQFRRIKEVRKIVENEENKAALIRMDWSENGKLFQCRQEKSAYYHDTQISINTAVLYQSDGRVTCIGSLSDDTSHKSTAVWASLDAMFTQLNLINLNDIDHFYIVTDSPSSQYRNKSCAYLTKQFAIKNKFSVAWLFTESGHGKGPMDGVGASIKNAIDEAVIGAESMSLAFSDHQLT